MMQMLAFKIHLSLHEIHWVGRGTHRNNQRPQLPIQKDEAVNSRFSYE
jgi:hypothetical protein